MLLLFCSIFILFSITCVGAVLNGKVTAPGQFTYQALLKLDKGTVKGTCAGAIIDETHILTAWHCVEDVTSDHIEVIVGAVDYDNDPNAMSYWIDDIKLHQSRSCKLGQVRCYDIAVLELSDTIQYKAGLINEIDVSEIEPSLGEECIFAGWGISEIDSDEHSEKLMYGHGIIWPTDRCKHILGPMNDYEFCFRHITEDPSTIHDGDSGAPLVCDGKLVGVIIRGGGYEFEPVIVIGVQQLLSFIYDNDEKKC